MQRRQQHLVQIVNRTVITLRDQQFPHGYEQGYRDFQQQHYATTLSDMHVYEMIKNIVVPIRPARWSAGYITGWMAALFESFPLEQFSVATVIDLAACDTTTTSQQQQEAAGQQEKEQHPL
jgi:hypothetical protein